MLFSLSLQQRIYFVLLFILFMVSAFLSLTVGAISIEFADLVLWLKQLLGIELEGDVLEAKQLNFYILSDLRLPRLSTALIVGLGLAVSGVASQGLFRNPLADPSLIGVSSGSALAAVFVIVLGPVVFTQFEAISAYVLPLFAFLGGLMATVVALNISSKQGRTDTALLLLSGVAINAICGAGIGLLSYMADDAQLRDLTFWSMGSVSKAAWDQIAVATIIILPASIYLLRCAKALNCLLMGESVAAHIGFNVVVLKRLIIGLTSLVVGAAVAISGTIGFVGLVVPHIMRQLFGSNHQFLLPSSMLFGASIMLLADVLARVVVVPAELPVGLVMSMLGGPFFLALLIKQRHRLSA